MLFESSETLKFFDWSFTRPRFWSRCAEPSSTYRTPRSLPICLAIIAPLALRPFSAWTEIAATQIAA